MVIDGRLQYRVNNAIISLTRESDLKYAKPCNKKSTTTLEKQLCNSEVNPKFKQSSTISDRKVIIS